LDGAVRSSGAGQKRGPGSQVAGDLKLIAVDRKTGQSEQRVPDHGGPIDGQAVRDRVKRAERRNLKRPTAGDVAGVAGGIIEDVQRPLAIWASGVESVHGGAVRTGRGRRIENDGAEVAAG